jgi:phospholipase/lecithinase/hemolysin
MSLMKMRGWLMAALLTFRLTAPASAEIQFSNIYAFGDSLSDAGNIFAATGQPPSPPYAQRVSNGPVWVEQLAPLLGAPVPTPSLLGGTDYAFAFGRATNTGLPPNSFPSVEMQVGQFLLDGHAPAAQELYILWGGANDLFDGQTNPAIPSTAITNQVKALSDAGAKHILVMNLPPIQLTPDLKGAPIEVQQGAAAYIGGFNALLANGLDALDVTLPEDVNLYQFDTAGLFNELISNGAAYGLTNVTERAFNTLPFPSVAANPNEYLFWDGVHPTTRAHGILAAAVVGVVPEPGSTLMVIGGLSLLIVRRFPSRR